MFHGEHRVRTGTAGWTIPKALAQDFPLPGSHMERYARRLHCAELNSPFYRPPRAATWAKWAAAVPEGFRFSVKAHKAITHEGKLAGPAEPLVAFLDGARALGEKLGPILFQLPPKLAFDASVAEAFLLTLRDLHTGPVCFEPRNASWFTAEAAGVLRHFEIARVAADPARVAEAALPGGWERLVYFRLHGSPRTYYSAYAPEYLEALSAALARHAKSGSEVWCIFDNTASGAALDNALTLTRTLATASTDA